MHDQMDDCDGVGNDKDGNHDRDHDNHHDHADCSLVLKALVLAMATATVAVVVLLVMAQFLGGEIRNTLLPRSSVHDVCAYLFTKLCCPVNVFRKMQY